jgi:hypothetical protein
MKIEVNTAIIDVRKKSHEVIQGTTKTADAPTGDEIKFFTGNANHHLIKPRSFTATFCTRNAFISINTGNFPTKSFGDSIQIVALVLDSLVICRYTKIECYFGHNTPLNFALILKQEIIMRVAFYLRVSTDDQTIQNQRRDLDEVAERLGWDVVAVYADEGISGSKGRDGRPGFDDLMKASVRKEFDMIAAWSVCRLGRSLQDLVGFLAEINDRGIDLYLHKQGLDTSTPTGRMMFQMLGVFSEVERVMISERVKAGLARTDKKIGRPGVGD